LTKLVAPEYVPDGVCGGDAPVAMFMKLPLPVVFRS
jgi:hypothetical protein